MMKKWKLKWIWFKQDVQRFYYKTFHGIKTDYLNGSMLPVLGRGRFVDVIRKGSCIDIISHTDYPNCQRGTIRLVPCQSNHGVMVEFINEHGRLESRSSCDYRQFYLMSKMLEEKKN